ncbi:MAG TPA: glutamate racemase, partial [Phenylobacterium sp.]|nr:glutamate racemase [Phenylobacterium sp.]
KPEIAVFSEGCPDLARLIESGAPIRELAAIVAGHVGALAESIGRPPDRAVLGCTHYEIVADLFRAALPPGTPLIHQPEATADALARYLERHTEYDPGSGGGRRFLTTGRPGAQSSLVEAFWGTALSFERA